MLRVAVTCKAGSTKIAKCLFTFLPENNIMCDFALSPLQLRELILNTTKPIVLRKFQTNWSCFKQTLSSWCAEYDAASKEIDKAAIPLFERVSQLHSQTPQWERKREQLHLTATEFLEVHSKPQDFWTGLNYKRAHQLPSGCLSGVDFSCFGFPQHNNDFTLWLSSPGANTPCHYDTYGCNIVVQIYGRKSWVLFPPNASLTTTRIPYEESSVYAQENFYAPKSSKLELIAKNLVDKAYYCVLEPEDVLIVPHHWWHYVETLDTSLSINYWVPLKRDFDTYLEELIVKYLIESFVKRDSDSVQRYILNPNQLAEITDTEQLFKLYSSMLKLALEVNDGDKRSEFQVHGQTYWPYEYKKYANFGKFLQLLPNAEMLTAMTPNDFRRYLFNNSSRCIADVVCDETSHLNDVQELLINSICAPHIVERIKCEFYKRKLNGIT